MSSYIAVEDHTSGVFATDLAAGKWQLFAEGGDYVLPTTTGNSGKFLSTDGTDYTWAEIADADTVLYFPSTISSSETWATAGQRFSYDSLTVGSGAAFS